MNLFLLNTIINYKLFIAKVTGLFNIYFVFVPVKIT